MKITGRIIKRDGYYYIQGLRLKRDITCSVTVSQSEGKYVTVLGMLNVTRMKFIANEIIINQIKIK